MVQGRGGTRRRPPSQKGTHGHAMTRNVAPQDGDALESQGCSLACQRKRRALCRATQGEWAGVCQARSKSMIGSETQPDNKLD